MPIGKDSITKRVAKTEEKSENIAPELVATVAVPETKAPAKKATAKKAPAKKPAAPKAEAEKAVVDTAVLSNVAPETVEAVIGHKEDEKYEKIQIGQKMPTFLM